MTVWVILLRGLTPTGKNKVPMEPLRRTLAETGLENVRTYIQSGNVMASSNMSQPLLEKLVHDTIKHNFGGDITVMARTGEQFRDAFERNPFTHGDKSKLYFSLLGARPVPKLVEDLLSIDFSPDKVHVVGDTIYTLYATKYSDSKFNNNYFERKLKVPATTRNFNTMSRLVELSSV